MSTTKHCSKCRRPRRAPDQSYCDYHHAKASKAHRDRRREELKRLRALAARVPLPPV